MTADTQTLHSPAWLRFVCFEGRGLFLSDRLLYSKKHRAHMADDEENPLRGRYQVVSFNSDVCWSIDCECGEALSGLSAPVICRPVVLHDGDDLAAANTAFDDAEAELRRVAIG